MDLDELPPIAGYGVQIRVLDGKEYRQAFMTWNPDEVDADATRQMKEAAKRQRILTYSQPGGNRRYLISSGQKIEDEVSFWREYSKSVKRNNLHFMRQMKDALSEGEITAAEWHGEMLALIRCTYTMTAAQEAQGQKTEQEIYDRAQALSKPQLDLLDKTTAKLKAGTLKTSAPLFDRTLSQLAPLKLKP